MSFFVQNALGGLALLTILYLKLYVACPGKLKRHKSFSNVGDIHAILSPVASRTSMLEARAAANERLIHAFNLTTSTFTNSSSEFNQLFRRNAATAMKRVDSTDNWKAVSDEVLLICRYFLLCGQPVRYEYDEFMQVVVFITILLAFFPSDNYSLDSLDFTQVSAVSNGINKLWIDSKSPGFDKTPNRILPGIHDFLRKWIDPAVEKPFTSNPLEIIIPAYETMWRLVAHAFARIENNVGDKQTFLSFSENPTISQFKALGNDGCSASAENIIQETLRLYPPTKRIKRALPLSGTRQFLVLIGFRSFADREVISANIERLHTSSVWDPSPHEFDALRHRSLTEEQKQSFLPFGYGPLKCIAADFAPRFAAVIVGSLLKIEDVVLIRGKTHGEREGWKGWEIHSK